MAFQVPFWFVLLALITGAAVAGPIGWALKPHPFKGKTILVGLRAKSGRAALRAVRPQRGIYVWKEKDFNADVHLDNAFLWDEATYGTKLVEVDLDSQHPIRYLEQVEAHTDDTKDGKVLIPATAKDAEPDRVAVYPVPYQGSCVNDDDEIEVTYYNEKRKLKGLWRRLSGERLYFIRKDDRAKQLAALGATLWTFLTKVTPIVLIVLCVVVVALGIIVLLR